MTDTATSAPPTVGKPHVGLFATCLMDLFRPRVGFAAVKLLEDAGCSVEAPSAQTCCGQPALNSGDFADTRDIARQVIETFVGYDYVVGPSGSCMATIKNDYPQLFADDVEWRLKAQDLSRRSYELLSFLTDVLGVREVTASFNATATYHDSCSGLRGLGIKAQPRTLLASVKGLSLIEMDDSDVCCGFGGTFCVKYPEISEKIVSDKVANIEASGADTLLGGDLGCLLNMAGRLKRLGKPVRVYHTAEVLAGMADQPGLGDPEK
jgi:L-lactate dehydrogenase complex protein LldE